MKIDYHPCAYFTQSFKEGNVSSNQAREFLTGLYNKRLVNSVFNKYGLTSDSRLNLSDYQALLIGIGANVKKKDIRVHFESLKQNRHDWKDYKHLQDLPSNKVNELMDHFRQMIPAEILSGSRKNFKLSLKNIHRQYHSLVDKDLVFLQKCKKIHHFIFKKDQRVADAQYLGHEIAYADLKVGMIVPVRQINGELIYEEVKKNKRKDGYICSILTPLTQKTVKQIKVLFRGTQLDWSLYRDIESVRQGSAGHHTFKKYRSEFIQWIVDLIPKNLKPSEEIIIGFYGHSLGGGDAARGGVAIAHEITKVQKNHPLLKIGQIDIHLIHSVKVAKETNEELKKAVPILEKKKIKMGILGVQVEWDPVPKTGQVLLGKGISILNEIYKFKWIKGIPHCQKSTNVELFPNHPDFRYTNKPTDNKISIWFKIYEVLLNFFVNLYNKISKRIPKYFTTESTENTEKKSFPL